MIGTQDARLAAAAERLGPLARRDVPLGPLTTYRVGGPAALFVEARSLDDLRTVAEVVRDTDVPRLVLGRGSNLLVADRGFPGLVVTLGPAFAGLDIDGVVVDARGALPLPVLARKTVAAGLHGLEWAVGVPGSVGGAVRMNAGGHGSDVAARLERIHRLDLATGEDAVVPAERLGLRFRGSDLGADHVVVSARFVLEPGDRRRGEEQLAEIVRWRREHQPGGQNCGSVFVNPQPGAVAAAQLIDGLGLRGWRLGTAWVSEKHANFIQADEGGSADDVYRLLCAVRRRVHEATGVLLRAEVRLVGFDDADEVQHR